MVSDIDGDVFNGSNITLPTTNNVNYNRIIRLKWQQNAKPTHASQAEIRTEFNFDNLGFYKVSETGAYANSVSVKKGNKAVRGLSNINNTDSYTITANIKNNTSSSITNATLFFAVYDEYGILIDIAVNENNTINANTISTDIIEPMTAKQNFDDNCYIRLFVWNNTGDLIPVTLPRNY